MRARNILCILLIVGVFAAQAYAAGPYPDWISPSPTSENLVPIDNIEPVPNTGGEIGSSQTVNGFTQYSVDLGDATYFISDIQAGGLLQQGTADPSKPWDRFGTVVFEASTVGTVTRAPGYYPDTSNAFIKPNFPGVSALNLNQFAYLPTKNAVLVVDTKMKRTVGEIVTGTENTNIALDPRNLRSLIVSRPSNEVLVLNMDTYEVLRRVEVAQEPVDAAISSRANFVDHAFVVSALDNTLSVIDLYSESAPIRQTVALGISSARVFAHPSKDEIVVVDLALGVEIYTLSSDTSKLIDLSRSYTFGLNDEEILDVVASDDGSRLFLLIKSNLDGELSVRTLNTETGVENSWSFILASDTGRYALKNTVTIFSKNRLGLSAYLPNSSKSLLLEPATDRLTLANIVFESQTNYGARNFSDDGQQALSVDYSNLELVIETKDEDDTVIKLPSLLSADFNGQFLGPVMDREPVKTDRQEVTFQHDDKVSETVGVIVLKNEGFTSVALTSIEIDGADRGSFSFLASECTDAVLSPDASCEITVEFTGKGSKTHEAYVIVSNSVMHMPPLYVKLTGVSNIAEESESSSSRAALNPFSMVFFLVFSMLARISFSSFRRSRRA